MSKRNLSNPSDEADTGSAEGAIQRMLNGITPAMQRGLMLAGIVLAVVIIWLATRIGPNGTPAFAPATSLPAASVPASLPISLPAGTDTGIAIPPSIVVAASTEPMRGQATDINTTATLAPPATLKPAATKAPTETPLPTQTAAPTATPMPTATPTALPVPDWRAAGQLTSIEYINTIVIERNRPKTGLSMVIPGQDRIVLQVVGNIHAGIDLNKIKPENVRINGKAIRMVLPRAEIISVELMPEASRIYESDQTLIFSDYKGLEIEAMDEARQKLRENSEHNQKMLQMAETLARLQLTELLRSLGYEHIEIVFE